MENLAAVFLRIGIGFVLIYAAISAMVVPGAWTGFYPEFLQALPFFNSVVILGSVSELLIGLWILSGIKIFWPAILTALFMLAIIFSSLGVFLVTFRDVAIFFSALALAILAKKQ
ncbi:MAG: hypothetical protein HYT03_02235 [Candidatus Harrisonbacteria bacterium]|nr:hypothetical protein [Candidatus Harrisonbacteria bacterium]